MASLKDARKRLADIFSQPKVTNALKAAQSAYNLVTPPTPARQIFQQVAPKAIKMGAEGIQSNNRDIAGLVMGVAQMANRAVGNNNRVPNQLRVQDIPKRKKLANALFGADQTIRTPLGSQEYLEKEYNVPKVAGLGLGLAMPILSVLPGGGSKKTVAKKAASKADDVAKGVKSTLKVKPSTNVGKLKNSGIDTFTDLSKKIKFIDGRKTSINDVETVLGVNKDKIDDYVKGTKTGYGKIPTMLRGIEADTSKMVGAMLESKNPVIRGVGNSLRGFGSGLGKSSEDVARSLEFKGMQDYAIELQDRVMRYSHEVLNKDPKSLARVYAHLSPEDSGKLIKFNELTPDEREVANVYRVVSDFINQQNFDNGFISEANYLKNKGGKYMPRLLDVFEYPEEISKFIKKTGIKIDDAPYLKKGELTKFKKEHLIKDPGYLLGKRLRQTMFNDSVVKMSNALKNTPHVSDEAREGFVKLSDNKLYGALSGKYIKKNIYEDMVGFYSTHDGAQKFLDLMDKYDNNVVRKNFKKLMTVYNPGTHMGNMTSNPIFAWMNGIAPQKYIKQVPFAIKQEKTKGALYRHLQKSGIVGTDLMKKDLADLSASVMSQVDDPTILKKIKGVDQQLINAYSKTDDVAKIAALKHWLDAGYTLEAATERVMRGFQNYNLVGYLYNIGAKTPLLGNPFVRFKGDWLRLVKNSMIDNPFHIASGLIAWQLFTTGMSKLSGETDEDRKTREGRLGAARFPGTDISTSVQTPFGELNASRLLGSVAMNDIGGKNLTGDLSDYSPFLIPQKSDKTGGLYNVSGDPVAGPLLSMAFDTDFRGKSISDPDSYAPGSSTLTNQEQNTNRAKFLARSYTPPVGNAVKDVVDAAAGKENFYGKEMSPGQAFLRLFPGVKVEKFGPEEAQAQRDREAGFADSKADALNRKIGTIENQLARGEITPEQAMSRIEALSDQRGTALEEAGYGEVRKDGGKYKVLINDEIKTINVGRVTSLPESNNFEKSIKRAKAFELSDDIITLLPQSQQQEALNELGISPSDAKYHYIAKQTNDAKVSYLQDQMPRYTDRNQLIGALVQGRAEINNKIFSTGTLLDDLQDLGYITKDEAKYIESIKSINGNLVSKKSGGKKAKAPTLKIKLPKRTKALKTATLKTIKPIKLQNIKKTKAPK